MKTKKLLLFVFSTLLIAGFSFFATINTASAQGLTNSPIDGLNQSANQVNAFSTQVDNYNSNFLQTKAGQIVGTVLSFVGVLFLILMIYAGILWMTAQGNEQQVMKAKGMLVNSVIGLIIVFAAYAITSFIGSEILR